MIHYLYKRMVCMVNIRYNEYIKPPHIHSRMTIVLTILLVGCTPEVTKHSNDPIFASNRTREIPQHSDDWWSEEDELSNIYAGAGVLMEDIDLDGFIDIVLLRRSGVHIWLNRIDYWEEMSHPAVDFLAGDGSILDWDKDGDNDILINTVFGPDVMWIQDEGTWAVQEIPSPNFSSGGTWYDVNHDGLLDVLLSGYGNDQNEDLFNSLEAAIPYPGEANQLLLQSTSGTFTPVEDFDTVELDAFTFKMTALPFRNSINWDLLVVNDFGHVNGGHQLYRLDGGNYTIEEPNHGLDIGMFGMGIDATDLNNDRIPDVLITDIGNPALLLSIGDTWVNSALQLGFEFPEDREVCWGVDWYDINNDGSEDVWIGCGPLLYADQDQEYPAQLEQPDALYLSTSSGFEDVSANWGIDRTTNTRGGGFVDLDNDGCAELVRVARNGPAEIFIGQCPKENRWIDIRLDDENAGVGATITVDDGQNTQIRWMTAGGTSLATYLPLQVHFGFGALSEDATIAVQVTWRDGTTTDFLALEIDQRVTLRKDGTYD